jgi:hypothetical protein
MQKINRLMLAVCMVMGLLSTASAATATLSGTHLLDSLGKKLPPLAMSKRAIQRSRNIYQVGDLHTFKTFNFSSKKWEETSARLLKTGDNICLYLEEGQQVDEKILDALIREFDQRIYPITTKYFGSEARPGIDGDNRLTVLLMDIKDDADTSGVYTSGYFNRADCYLPDEIPAGTDLQSNSREMLYADINPSDITSTEFFATIAHELQHLVHFFHDQQEYEWLNEGCSQMAPWLCGYGHPRQISAWQKNPDNSLLAWAPWQQVANYGQVYLWTYYVMNRFCRNDAERVRFFRELVSDREHGMASYEKLFQSRGADFAAIFNNFCIASFVNRKGVEPQLFSFGDDLGSFQLPATTFVDKFPSMLRGNVCLWSADLVKVAVKSNMSEIKIAFAGDLNSLPNSFSVALVFFNEAESRVGKIEYIDNIKSTTPNSSVRVSRVMKPGYGDDYYPPPPVKTQMGHISVQVPSGSDMLYLIIIGRGPADLPDSMLSWSGKVNYRLDIEAVVESGLPAGNSTASSPNVANLLHNYLATADKILEDGGSADSQEVLAAIESELKASLISEIESEAGEKPVLDAIMAGGDELISLKKSGQTLLNFHNLHR